MKTASHLQPADRSCHTTFRLVLPLNRDTFDSGWKYKMKRMHLPFSIMHLNGAVRYQHHTHQHYDTIDPNGPVWEEPDQHVYPHKQQGNNQNRYTHYLHFFHLNSPVFHKPQFTWNLTVMGSVCLFKNDGLLLHLYFTDLPAILCQLFFIVQKRMV